MTQQQRGTSRHGTRRPAHPIHGTQTHEARRTGSTKLSGSHDWSGSRSAKRAGLASPYAGASPFASPAAAVAGSSVATPLTMPGPRQRDRRGRSKRQSRGAGERRASRQEAQDGGQGLSPRALLDIPARVVEVAGAHRVASAVILVMLVCVLSLWGPVRDYYVARRTGEVLQQEYASVTSERDSLTDDVNRLMSTDGIEEEARKIGYVYDGETPVSVTGVSQDQQPDPSAPKTYQDDRDWQTKALDTLFGFDPSTV